MSHDAGFGTPNQIRRRVLKSRNKTLADFDNLHNYNDYLFETDGIISDFLTGSHVDEASDAMKTYRVTERRSIEKIRQRQEAARVALYGKKSKKSREKKRVAHVAALRGQLSRARYDQEFYLSALAYGWIRPSDVPKDAFSVRKKPPESPAGGAKEQPTATAEAVSTTAAGPEQVYLPSLAKIKGPASQPAPVKMPQSAEKRRRTSRRIASSWDVSATGGLPRSVVDIRATEEAFSGLFVFGR